MSAFDPKVVLKQAGLKVTPRRVKLLMLLAKENMPLTALQIHKKMGRGVNEVTLYRALEALASANIVRTVEFQHGHAHFELAKEHHHHAVCENCGTIEDIEVPHSPSPERDALKATKRFSKISDYSLEFFGLCKECAHA